MVWSPGYPRLCCFPPIGGKRRKEPRSSARVWGWVRVIIPVMVEFGIYSLLLSGNGLGVRDRKVKSRDCALASDLVRANLGTGITNLQSI